MIYFIQRPVDRLIKIGRTDRLPRRLRELTRQYGPGLDVLAVLSESRYRENAVHRLFLHLWVEGEWFRAADDLFDFIERHGKLWDETDDVLYETVRLPADLMASARIVAEIEHLDLIDVLMDILEPGLRIAEREAVARRIAAVGLGDRGSRSAEQAPDE